jgi:hypothetical protein
MITDVLVDRKLTSDEIVSVLRQVFGLSSSEVLVVDEMPEEPIGNNVGLICERREVNGEFCLILSLYVQDGKFSHCNEADTIGRFCEISHCRCLISDNSINPYSFFLVQSPKGLKNVFLDANRLEDNEEYTLETLPGD